MANTKIQIKRSTVSSSPNVLDAGELGYSYVSNKLFIGNSTGTGVLEIIGAGGGSESSNNYAGFMANAANAYASSVGIAANVYASAVGSSANNYAGVMANSVNSWATGAFVNITGDTITGDLVIQGNLTTSGVVTYANTQTLLIGDSLITLNNDIPTDVAPSENAGIEVKRGSSANVALLWNEGSDKWSFTNDGTNYRLIASNTDIESANSYASSVGAAANLYADAVGVSANVYAALVAGYANTNAANGSYISTGVVKVPFGGTGLTTFTQNGILFGNTAGDLKVTAAGTEGQVLQASAIGVPSFGMLDGGSF
jgi:hypothetical protein